MAKWISLGAFPDLKCSYRVSLSNINKTLQSCRFNNIQIKIALTLELLAMMGIMIFRYSQKIQLKQY